jgi:hypothetical protein
MFTPEERESLRSELIEIASADARVSGGALTGSASLGKEDRWSDIDLVFGVRDAKEVLAVRDAISEKVYSRFAVAHHLDLNFGTWVFRVFFLKSTLQVDLGFVQADEFCAISHSFNLLFGECVEKPYFPPPEAGTLIGWAWLYALHVRSCIERGKFWRAEYMLSGMRDNVLALACLRHGLETSNGRGFDQLPLEDTQALRASLVSKLDRISLVGAFSAATDVLVREVRYANLELAQKLEAPLRALLISP